MNTFSIQNGQFLLNNQPLLIQAGEFHYFRTPVDQWAHRLGLLRQAGFNTVASYIPWLWHQPEPNISDVEGHTHPMRNLAGFLDLATEMGFWIIARPGPYIMAETINEGIPPWVFQQSPQVAYVGQDGKAQNIASYLHPDFLNYVVGWYKAVFSVLTPRQVTRGGNILMMNMDNEMGMIQWVRNLTDTNPDTIGRFEQYLRDTYGERLAHRYPDWATPDFWVNHMRHPQSPYLLPLIEDYRRFYRGYLRAYTLELLNYARSFGMEVPPVINIHGFGNGGKTFPIGLSQLVDVMALETVVSATDVYPIFIGEGNFHQLVLVNEMTKALHAPEQPLFSIEFQAGGNQDFGGAQTSLYDLHTRLSVSCGMRGINHYLFFDGENDPVLSPTQRHDWGHPVRKDGSVRRHYARYGQLSRVFSSYGQAFLMARPKTVTTIGFQIDAFMTEVNNAQSRPLTDQLTHQREVILFDFLARGLALTHRPFDAIEINRAPLDSQKMPLLWVMMDKQSDAPTQQKLAEYVESGGTLVCVGRLCEETFNHTPCTILQTAIGVQVAHTDPPFIPKRIQAFGYHNVPASFVETYEGVFDVVFATTSEGHPVGVVKRVGQGRMVLFGASLGANTLEDLHLFDQIANLVGCAPLFSLSDWADVRLLEGENGSFLFLNHYQDDSLSTVIHSQNKVLFRGNPVHLAARRGAILPLEWHLAEGILIQSLTSEVIDVQYMPDGIQLTTAQAECFAEVHLEGYSCDTALIVAQQGTSLTLHITQGKVNFIRQY